ncbi:MAG: hypothetical protein H6653_15435 [Ardenticatenaceae bacterium]|nr:hypothetical protein [Ardenticatenaceae bacterium]
MFRRIFGVGLLILLLMGIFGGFGSRTRAAYYEGYADGMSAQTSAAAEDDGTAVPVYPPHYDGFGHGRFLGWGALGILGIFAFFFKIAFFFLLAMIVLRLIFGRRRWRRGPWQGHGPWGHHHKHGHHGPGPEKGSKWMHDSDDDEPVMTV